ncbi:hypothetical protein V6N13_101124 [Hibiscus sabdariffa]
MKVTSLRCVVIGGSFLTRYIVEHEKCTAQIYSFAIYRKWLSCNKFRLLLMGVTDGVLPSEEFIEEDLVSLFFTTRWEYDHRAVLLLVVSGDEDAIRCKVVALIKADKIEDAFSKIQYAQKDSFDFSFYKAYCLYRQNKLDEVLELLSWHIILLVL